jgi:tetratricopeptide (TPR) repeat protein
MMAGVRAKEIRVPLYRPDVEWSMFRHLPVALTLTVAMGLALAMAATGEAQEGGDLQAQILYASQTQDLNLLADLVQSLSERVKAGGADPALRYHLAHAEYRFAELGAQRRSQAAEAALGDCVDQLKGVLDQNAGSVEALTLQSMCYDALADHATLRAALLRSRAADRLAAAYKLAPRNPRVLLRMAEIGLERAKPDSPEHRRALALLGQAVEIFEQTSATGIDAPGWGHAEAYLAYGRQFLMQGDLVAARNWTERALLAAPDYEAAQRQLTAIQAH